MENDEYDFIQLEDGEILETTFDYIDPRKPYNYNRLRIRDSYHNIRKSQYYISIFGNILLFVCYKHVTDIHVLVWLFFTDILGLLNRCAMEVRENVHFTKWGNKYGYLIL